MITVSFVQRRVTLFKVEKSCLLRFMTAWLQRGIPETQRKISEHQVNYEFEEVEVHHPCLFCGQNKLFSEPISRTLEDNRMESLCKYS
jgi:hypothetical protein